MDQYEWVRTAHRVYKESIRQIARETGRTRRTVRVALVFGLLGSFVRAWGEWRVDVILRVILSRRRCLWCSDLIGAWSRNGVENYLVGRDRREHFPYKSQSDRSENSRILRS